MGSTKLLKGLSYNLLQSYLSTLCYYKSGYMADWLFFGAIYFNINNIEIDIMQNYVSPKELNIKALLCYLDKLKLIIDNFLSNNDFSNDFITKAYMKFEIIEVSKKLIKCNAEITDKNGKIYKSKELIECAYETIDFKLKYNE